MRDYLKFSVLMALFMSLCIGLTSCDDDDDDDDSSSGGNPAIEGIIWLDDHFSVHDPYYYYFERGKWEKFSQTLGKYLEKKGEYKYDEMFDDDQYHLVLEGEKLRLTTYYTNGKVASSYLLTKDTEYKSWQELLKDHSPYTTMP